MAAQAAQDSGMESGIHPPDSIPSSGTESTDREEQDVPPSILKPEERHDNNMETGMEQSQKDSQVEVRDWKQFPT